MRPIRKKRSKDPNKYPRGWNRKKVQELMNYYENQSEDEAVAEAKAAFNDTRETVMLVPCELVSQVQTLLANHRGAARRSGAGGPKKNRGAARRGTHRQAHAA